MALIVLHIGKTMLSQEQLVALAKFLRVQPEDLEEWLVEDPLQSEADLIDIIDGRIDNSPNSVILLDEQPPTEVLDAYIQACEDNDPGSIPYLLIGQESGGKWEYLALAPLKQDNDYVWVTNSDRIDLAPEEVIQRAIQIAPNQHGQLSEKDN